MMDLIRSEPVMFQGIIQAGLAMIMSFGVHLTVEQMGTILVFTGAVLTFWTRQAVTAHPNNPSLNDSLKEKP